MIVEKDERVIPVNADGIRAAALALRFADVDPTLVPAAAQKGIVLLPERREPL